jgi:hypothetical protein
MYNLKKQNLSWSKIGLMLTIDEWWGGDGDLIFQFLPDGDGVKYKSFAWLPTENPLDAAQWFMQYLDTSTFDEDLFKDYIKVYNRQIVI